MTATLDTLLDGAAEAIREGDPNRAITLLHEVGPDAMLQPRFWFLRGMALAGLSQFPESAEAFETLADLAPADAEPRALAADAHLRGRALAAAERQLLLGLARHPGSTVLLEEYCRACALAGQTEKARSLLARLREVQPRNEEAFSLQILIEFIEGNESGQFEAVQRYLSGIPDSAEKSLQMARSFFKTGRFRLAARWFEQAIIQDPSLREREPDLDGSIRVLKSRILLPNQIFDRFGPWRTWAVAAVLMIVLPSIHEMAGLVFIMSFAGLVLYSWIVLPIAIRWISRRRTPTPRAPIRAQGELPIYSAIESKPVRGLPPKLVEEEAGSVHAARRAEIRRFLSDGPGRPKDDAPLFVALLSQGGSGVVTISIPDQESKCVPVFSSMGHAADYRRSQLRSERDVGYLTLTPGGLVAMIRDLRDKNVSQVVLDPCPRCSVFSTFGSAPIESASDIIEIWSIVMATQRSRLDLYLSHALDFARGGDLAAARELLFETAAHVSFEDPRIHLLAGQVASALGDRRTVDEAKALLRFFDHRAWEERLDEAIRSGASSFAMTESSSAP